MMNEEVNIIMTKDPIHLSPDNTLGEVHKMFEKSRIHHIPITDDENNLVGLVTTYDLWKMDKTYDTYKDVKIKDVMRTKLAKISPTDKIGTAAELFLDNRFHALPVVDGTKLVGLVTSFDVLLYEFRKEYDKPILFEDIYSKGLMVK